MSDYSGKADRELLQNGVFVGRHPDTGVIHRLTIHGSMITIERQPYRSKNPDGWVHYYETITHEADQHLFLILKIKQNPCDWSEKADPETPPNTQLSIF